MIRPLLTYLPHTRPAIVTSIQVLTMLWLCYLTLLPVDVRWSEPEILLASSLPVMGVLACVSMLLQWQQIRWTWTDALLLTWMGYWILRLWMGGECPCATTALKGIQLFLLYVMLRGVFTGCKRGMVSLFVILMMTGGAIEAFWGIWQIYAGTSRHSSYMLTGSFFNPGPYSGYLLLSGTIALVLYENGKGKWLYSGGNEWYDRYANWIEEVLVYMGLFPLLLLPATWSRAAWVSFAFLALWIERRRYWRWRWPLWLSLAAIGIAAYFVKQGSADGRLIIWQSALTAWGDSPWWGVGVGRFCHACGEGLGILYAQATDDIGRFRSAGVTEYAYNAGLKIWVEQGVIGAILCLLTTVSAMIRMYRISRPLFWGLASLLLFSCFSYPFELSPYCIIVVLSVAVTQGCAEELHAHELHSPRTLMKRGVVCLSLCLAATGIACPMQEEINRRHQSDADYAMMSGIHDPWFIKDYWELLDDERDNPRFLFSMAELLRKAGRWHDSNALLRMGTEVSADPMFYVLQGNNYQEMGFDDEAEKAYLKAFSIMPNRHYPLYQLMLLYEKTQQKEKATDMARRILSMKPKIKSPATDEMQQKARDYLGDKGS